MNQRPKHAASSGNSEGSSSKSQADERETTGAPEPMPGSSIPNAPTHAEPITIETLRRKLDAAIVAEAWEAVKAIRQRMIEVEREGAGNVVALDVARRGRA